MVGASKVRYPSDSKELTRRCVSAKELEAGNRDQGSESMSQFLPLLGLLCAKRRKLTAKCREIGARDVGNRKNNDLEDCRTESSGGAGLDNSKQGTGTKPS